MSPEAVIGMIDMIGNATNNLVKAGSGIESMIFGKTDRDFAKQQYAENKAFRDMVYKETKEREDTAVQRRVADLAGAGLSPLAEIGGATASGASGSSIGSSSISVANPSYSGNYQSLLGIEKTGAEIANIETETAYKVVQTDLVKAQTEQIMAQTKLTDEQLKNMSLKNKMDTLELSVKKIVTDAKVSNPDEVVKDVMNQMKKSGLENKLIKADTVKKYSDVVNDSLNTACNISSEVRRWIMPWKK